MRIHTTGMLCALLAVNASPAQQSAQEVLEDLRSGNARYAAGAATPRPMGPGLRRSLARGQSPKAIVVTCADSRVVPEHLFNAGFGELYVVRVAGNVADPATVAAIEHAALDLSCPVLVVLGHEDCGAVRDALTGNAPSPAAAQLLRRIEPAVRRARALGLGGKEMARGTEKENVHQTVSDAMRQSELLQRLVRTERLTVVRGHYALASGVVEWLPDQPVAKVVPAAPGGESAPTRKQPNLPPHVALRLLQAGHRRYLSAGEPRGDLSPTRRSELAEKGEHPMAVVVTDADSRVPPELIFDAGLGEIVTVRAPGPVLTPEVLASIEYAAAGSGASLCIVLGHSGKGILGRMAEGTAHVDTGPIQELKTRLGAVIERARAMGGGEELVRKHATTLLLEQFLGQARKNSRKLRELEGRGELALLSAVYDIETGDLSWLRERGSAPTHGPSPGTSKSMDHGHDPHQPEKTPAETESSTQPSTLDPDLQLLEQLASAPSPAHGEEGTPEGPLEAETPKAAKKDETMTLVILGIVGLLSAGLGVGLLIWMQRSKAKIDAEDDNSPVDKKGKQAA